MTVMDGVRAVFAFRTIPTTVLLVLVYLAVFISVFETDDLPVVPSVQHQNGLNFDQAWADLHEIAARPHPYNSHANDLVRTFILDRVSNIAKGHRHVTVIDDLSSSATWTSGLFSSKPYAVYHEGRNVLVKIDGTESDGSDQSGVLFSAHFDSVSTAPGATDDGMGVATLLQLVAYFAANRPRRTVVFNINNGEEDGLNGAYAYMNHPWSNLTDVFINLEGAAAGGRPLLFRTTDNAPVDVWSADHTTHVHANIVSSDVFNGGSIRSDTDYSVYKHAMEGLDFAFYRGRARYHTKHDSIIGIAGGGRALWAMMEATLGAGVTLAGTGDEGMSQGVGPGAHTQQDKHTYFELFGAALVNFRNETLFTINVVLLVVGPIFLLALVYSESIVEMGRHLRHGRQLSEDVGGDRPIMERIVVPLRRWARGFWRWAKFWAALVIGAGLQVLLVVGYVILNPFAVHSHPIFVFVSMLSLAYLTTVLTISAPLTKALPIEQQKLSMLLQTYVFSWILLVGGTVRLRQNGAGGIYLLATWNAAALLASILGVAEALTYTHAEGAGGTRYVRGVRYDAVSTSVEDAGGSDRSARSPTRTLGEGTLVETAPTEITPLIQQRQIKTGAGERQTGGEDDTGTIGWWILQMLVLVPLPVILMVHVAIILMYSMNQILTDGLPPYTVYAPIATFALFIVLPIAPFSMAIHRSLTVLVFLVLVASTAYTWAVFPFNYLDPLKVYFSQSVDIVHSGAIVTTSLLGPSGWLSEKIVPELPSAHGRNVSCKPAGDKLGLDVCEWEVDAGGRYAPYPGSSASADEGENEPWVSWTATRIEAPGSGVEAGARFNIKGRNSRGCILYFDNHTLTSLSVNGEKAMTMTREQGVRQARVWNRNFGGESEVIVGWAEPDLNTTEDEDGESEKVTGRVECQWDEYESGTVGGGDSGARIPALEEVLEFLPEWATVTKRWHGLVRASVPFSI
ncbi:hypothetical protein CONPUDRAFT_54548 [Coniophora puteana RWD-64-598 SS2]|uniref:Peptide hydrolase n=1 Tax=Coniophora puteana (strain RWD-64-598) TaxID=741705 RepID=A0A5M3MSU1_CONPW|nr:uncharacterized protein CONPUDRAFT_54548 [Coniophora puteana RWD-64-598 SS2]EIW82238.1 hypothetical protein CONPUDRAFT_54548 [Coniophora puteana RWD-64-598 SS2]